MKMYCRTSGAGALLWLAMVLPATGLACTPASAAAAAETAADGTLPAADPPRQVAVRTRSCPQPLSLRGSLDLGSHSVQNRDGGGYLRAVLPLSSQLYLFGGVDRMSRRLPRDATRLKVVIDQGELGLGARLPLSARLGLVAEASALRLATTLEFQHQQYPQLDFRQREQFPAAKVMVGAHALPLAQLELWAKAGYLRVADNRRIGDSEVLSAGALYRLDARWGVLGEVERYKQLRFYRLGLRATF